MISSMALAKTKCHSCGTPTHAEEHEATDRLKNSWCVRQSIKRPKFDKHDAMSSRPVKSCIFSESGLNLGFRPVQPSPRPVIPTYLDTRRQRAKLRGAVSVPCRNSLGTRTCAQRWFTPMSSTAGGEASGVRPIASATAPRRMMCNIEKPCNAPERMCQSSKCLVL